MRKVFVGLRNLGNFYLNETTVQSCVCSIKSIEHDFPKKALELDIDFTSRQIFLQTLWTNGRIELTFHLFQFENLYLFAFLKDES